MASTPESSLRIPISPNFFCDGACYLLTSASLGGSTFTADQISALILDGTANDIEPLLKQGICIPLCFDGDCALDRATFVVVGNLTEQEQQDWVGRLSWKLSIPCGKFVILCGGGYADDLAHAISDEPPDPDYEIFQVFDVPPGDYQAVIYAYPPSLTVYQHRYSLLDSDDEAWEDRDLDEPDYDAQGNLTTVSYIIQLMPLVGNLLFPSLDADGWCDTFEFRELD